MGSPAHMITAAQARHVSVVTSIALVGGRPAGVAAALALMEEPQVSVAWVVDPHDARKRKRAYHRFGLADELPAAANAVAIVARRRFEHSRCLAGSA